MQCEFAIVVISSFCDNDKLFLVCENNEMSLLTIQHLSWQWTNRYEIKNHFPFVSIWYEYSLNIIDIFRPICKMIERNMICDTWYYVSIEHRCIFNNETMNEIVIQSNSNWKWYRCCWGIKIKSELIYRIALHCIALTGKSFNPLTNNNN